MSQTQVVESSYLKKLEAAVRAYPAAPKLNVIDRIVGFFNPRALIERGQQRYAAHAIDQAFSRAAYKSAEVNRLNESWLTTEEDVNNILRKDLRRIRARSRWIIRNNPHGVGAVNAFVSYVIGTGMMPMATVSRLFTSTDAEGNTVVESEEMENWNNYVEDLFEMWAVSCDLAGSVSCPEAWVDSQALALRKLIEDGETFLHFVTDRKNPTVPLRIEFIEPDALDETITEYNGNPVIMGVEVDKDSFEPVAYWIRTRAPDQFNTIGYTFTSSRIPAKQLLHVFKRLRPKQVRGIPMMAAVCEDFYQLDEFTDAELISNRIAACFSAFVTAPQGSTGVPGMKAGEGARATDASGNILSTLEPGLIASIPQGSSITFANPQKPSSTFGPFTEYHLRSMGAGMDGGLSYEAFTRDTSKTAYAGGRLAQLMDYQTFRMLQAFFARKFCAPTWRKFLEAAVLADKITAPGYFDSKGVYGRMFWEKHMWMPPGWTWGINPLQEVRASVESMRSGVTTLADECAFQGRNWETNIRLTARINKLARKLGVTLESDAATGSITRRGEAPNPVEDPNATVPATGA